jgi:hypothetical protein
MLVFALLEASLAHATTVSRQSLEGLVSGSGRIVHGRVVRHWVAWDDTHRFLWTHYSLRVFDTVKGAPSATFVISEAGGAKDGFIMTVPGTVQYADGEEVVAFLHPTPIGYWQTFGYSQGKFSIIAGKVVSEEVGPAIIDLQGERGAGRTPLSNMSGQPLDRFKNLIRRMARREPSK